MTMGGTIGLLFGALVIGLGFILLQRITEWAQSSFINLGGTT